MKFMNKKVAIRAIVLLVAIGAGAFTWQSIGSLNSVRPQANPVVFAQQVDLVQSLYSRNLQAIELSEAIDKQSTSSSLIASAKNWKSTLQTENSNIKRWLQENRAPFIEENAFPRDFNIANGQLQSALQSFDDIEFAECIKSLAAGQFDATKLETYGDSNLGSIVASIAQADLKILTAAEEVLQN